MDADEKPAVVAEVVEQPEAAPLVPVVASQPARLVSEQKQLDKLKVREDRILEKAMATVEDQMAGRDIDDNHADEIPQEWIAEVGLEEAGKRLRVAKDSRRNKKEAPVYLDAAKAVMVGIIKARAGSQVTVNALNATFLLAAPQKAKAAIEGGSYPVIDIEPDDDTEK